MVVQQFIGSLPNNGIPEDEPRLHQNVAAASPPP